MSAVCIPDVDAPLPSEINTQHEDSSPTDRSTARDTGELEMLVRLVVRDELQRHPLLLPSNASNSDGAEESGYGRTFTHTIHTAEDESEATSDAEVMSAEEVAAFLGVDRNTVYDYAGRGTIPCRRLGKRLLFHRPVLVSWLDPCRAALTRKA
jgi:excisionase family DNA binding protein